MAMLDELFKGNMLTTVAVGLGAVLLAPLAGPVLRPAGGQGGDQRRDIGVSGPG